MIMLTCSCFRMLLSAKERGDLGLVSFLEKNIADHSNIVSDGCGGTYVKELSGFSNIARNTGIFSGPCDFVNAVKFGPAAYTFEGPLLAEAPYPEVIVAKAWSNGTNLDVILYPGDKPCKVTLSLERLKKGATYVYGEKEIIGDKEGKASIDVSVEGRTPVYLKLT